MAHVRMVKGKRTELTYKVSVSKDWPYWEAQVFEPFMKRRFWGLLPDTLDYRHVYERDTKIMYDQRLIPAEIDWQTKRAVEEYEEYKLAWESHQPSL